MFFVGLVVVLSYGKHNQTAVGLDVSLTTMDERDRLGTCAMSLDRVGRGWFAQYLRKAAAREAGGFA